jgi:hypothetical protein
VNISFRAIVTPGGALEIENISSIKVIR